MFILATVGTSVLSSLLADGASYIISSIWNSDERIQELRTTLEEKLDELSNTLNDMDANDGGLSLSSLPSDWLDELEQCRYEIEDIEDSMDSARKKQIVTKFLQTNIRYITLMQTKLRRGPWREKQRVELRQHANLEQEKSYQALPVDEFVRVEEKQKIVGELIMKSDSSGVSITGIGGIGKTQLAGAIVDEAIIKGHFSCILVPPPSSKFNLVSVLGYIEGRLPLDERVLVLLDGMHSVTHEDWHHFRSAITTRNPASKILITTPNPRVAEITGTVKHWLHPLSVDECFLMIQRRANANRNLIEADERAITHNKMDLVDSCKGLPLIANQIGLLLSAAPPGHRLRTIQEILTATSLWKIPDLGRVLVNLKPVSLLVQEPHLKRCLAYCTLFPQDHDFEEDALVEFWMAEGFTPVSTATRDTSYLEQNTRKDFAHLISCSIFQTSILSSNEEPSYKMHELAYDLAQYVASNTCFRKHIGKSVSAASLSSEIPHIARHFSLSCENILDDESIVVQLLSDIQKKCSGLRTFLLFHDAGKNISKNPTFFRSLTCLRVLDLSHTNLTKLEASYISELKYLRYLDLSHTPVKKLPKLSKNLALQVLKLNCCDNLLCLPDDITKLTNLVSLQMNTTGLGSMPPSIGKLRNLQKLDVFIVGDEEGFKIAELKNLNDLKKSLHIIQLEKVHTKLEAQETELHMKKHLGRLELEWTSSASEEEAKQVLEGLEPPKNLKELIIRNYCSGFPEWLSRTEVCGVLETIHLDGCTHLPSVDQLPMLKALLIGRNSTVSQPRNFPRLELLVLCEMSDLDQWIDLAANHMPCLHDLQVYNCDSLPMLPHLDCLTSLEKLQISGCTMLTELPTLPASLKSLVIKDSAILTQRCQVGQPDWSKIIGIKVEIDSDPVDTSVLHPDEAARHQSNGMQDQGTANGNQLTSPQLQSAVTKQMLCENDNIQDRSSVSCEKSSEKSSSGGFGLRCLGGCFRKME